VKRVGVDGSVGASDVQSGCGTPTLSMNAAGLWP